MSSPPDNIVPITSDARSAAEKFGAEHDRELLTILFTDLVDSTKLQSDLGNVEAARLVELHRGIVRDELAKYDAREIEWAGDSCLAVFTKPSDGVVFALRLQAALRGARAAEPKMPTVRIGLHLGEIVVRRNADAHKDDLFGLQVSEAARVMSLARGDQIYCTRSVFDNARGALKGQSIEGLAEVQWLRYGFFELKGSDEPAEVFEVGEEGLAPLAAPEANDKCRPIKGDLEKWRKRRAKQGQPRPGISTPILVPIIILSSILGAGLMWLANTRDPGPAVDTPITSIAVLPLDNLMNDPDQDYFVDGMTEALTAELAKISALKVISRTSTMQYKGTTLPLPEVADALGVDAIIEGSVFRAGDEVRITAQLIRGSTDGHVWAESYEGTLANVLGFQSDVALAIAEAIQVAVTPDEKARIAERYSTNPEAYDEYLRGLDRIQARSDTEMRAGIAHFERATVLDPKFAAAYARMAATYALLSLYWIEDPDIGFG